jgi:hypothetical protein
MIADELRRQADQFVDIVELELMITRDPAESAVRETRERAAFPPARYKASGAEDEEGEFQGQVTSDGRWGGKALGLTAANLST